MRYLTARVVFQEVPDEISLAFLATGCPMRCRGCHSSDAWNGGKGRILDAAEFDRCLEKSRGCVTCILFLGGEWEKDSLCELLDQALARGLKTCLYSGLELHQIDAALMARLTYLKVGSYRAELGGLDSPFTNQRFYEVSSGRDLTERFQSQGGHHDATQRTAT